MKHMCLVSSLFSQDDDGMKQIIIRVPDELKLIGDMACKLTGHEQQTILMDAYRDFIYRTIKFLPGSEPLVSRAQAFARYEHEKQLKDFQTKYGFSLLSQDSMIAQAITNPQKFSESRWNGLELSENGVTMIAQDSTPDREVEENPYWQEVDATVKKTYKHGDIRRLIEIFEKVEPRCAVIDIKAAEKSIEDCIPFEIREEVKIDALCELRYFISDRRIYTLDAYLRVLI
jgi:hypothetical protein